MRVETESLQMLETWEKGYRERAKKLLAMLAKKNT
jgi:hypothetical protein